MKHSLRRHSSTPAIIVVLLIAAASITVAYFLSKPKDATETVNTETTTTISAATPLPDAKVETPSGTETSSGSTTTYKDAENGFTLQYSSDWKVTQKSTGAGPDTITNVIFGTSEKGVTLIIAPASLEGMMQETFSTSSSKQVTINGATAYRSLGASAKDGKPVALLSFTKDASVYLLNGQPDTVDAVGATFRFN